MTILTKLIVLATAMLFSCTCNSQVLDSFLYTGVPDSSIWQGNLKDFIVENKYLRSNSQEKNHSFYLGMPIAKRPEYGHIGLSFGFNTSSKNYLDILLCADSLTEKPRQALVLRVGGVQDAIEVIERDSNRVVKVVQHYSGSTHRFQGNVLWEFEEQKRLKITINDSSFYTNSNLCDDIRTPFTGFVVHQSTSSFFHKHRFEHLYWGDKPKDVSPPIIINHELPDNGSLTLFFNEEMDTTWSGSIIVLDKEMFGYKWLNQQTLAAKSVEPWPVNTMFNLEIKNWRDLSKNSIPDTSISSLFLKLAKAKPFDIVINELMVDPKPSVNLPEAEFVELYNTSDKAIDLGTCTFSDASSTAQLPDIVLFPNSYTILASIKDSLNFGMDNTIFLNDFPTLNNSADQLLLQCNSQAIHWLDYDSDYMQNAVKEEGGWSLEMIDTKNPCGGPGNWAYSNNDAGGTPGRQNSISGINPDAEVPYLKGIGVKDNEVILELSEIMYPSLLDAFKFELKQASISPKSVKWSGRTSILLEFEGHFKKGWRDSLRLPALNDCVGFLNRDSIVLVAVPSTAAKSDIVFNEIMFDARTESSEFIELYNASENILDLAEVQLATKDDGEWSNAFPLRGSPTLFFLKTYAVFSENGQSIYSQYLQSDSTVFFDVGKMPNLSSLGGEIYLIDRKVEVIDHLDYSASNHFDLLKTNKGVSLERIHPTTVGYSSDAWVSASELSGGATPGVKNSQYYEPLRATNVRLEYTTFSPNNDGFRDRLVIIFNSLNPVQNTRIAIFTLNGILVKEILPRTLLGTEQTVFWDGKDNSGHRVSPDIYILLLEAYDAKGNIHRERLSLNVVY
jgi:hypothetical protein